MFSHKLGLRRKEVIFQILFTTYHFVDKSSCLTVTLPATHSPCIIKCSPTRMHYFGCIPLTRNRIGGLPDSDPLDRDPLNRETSGQRPPWTETPLDRDTTGQIPPGQRPPWTETPLDRDPLDRDPPGQRPSGQRPPEQSPSWTGTSLD